MIHIPRPPVRIALIGVSGYGSCHYKTIQSLVSQGLVSLDAATVINQQEEAEKCAWMRAHGCRIYSDYKAMLAAEAGKTDLCCIPTGIGWHRVMTVDALEAGMHVLVEKPVAASIGEVDAMREARDRTGKQVFVGFQNMYAAPVWQIKHMLVSGALGKLKRIRVAALWPRSVSYYQRTDWAGKLSLRNTPVLDSPANNAMAHFIQLAQFWAGSSLEKMGEITQLEAHLYRAQQIESFDTISARAQLAGGAELLINLSHSAEEFMEARIVIDTEDASYTWNDLSDSTLVFANAPEKNLTLPRATEATRIVMLQNICAHLQGTDSAVCSLEQGEAHTRLINRIHRECSILDVPQQQIQTVTHNTETFRQVEGLASALKQAHANGSLLPEVGLPWLAPASEPHMSPA